MSDHLRVRSPPGGNSSILPAEVSSTLSATFDSSGSVSTNSKSFLDVSRVELEKRQLVHTIQLLKLELSQKQLLLDTDRNEHASQLEELQEHLADARHGKKLAELQLQSATFGYEQELNELRKLLEEQRTRGHGDDNAFKDTDTIIGEIRREVEQALSLVPALSKEEEKLLISSADLSHLAIGDYVRLRFFELTKPLQKHTDDLQRRIGLLNQQMSETQAEVLSSKDVMEEERERCRQLERRCLSLTSELTSVKTRIQEDDYKIQHFDSVKRDRDALKVEVNTLSTAIADKGRREGHLRDELDRVTKELSSARQMAELLGHDKDYLSRQVSNMTSRIAALEEKLDMVTEELTEAKQEKDKLFREFMNSKEEERLAYSHKLEAELESLRQKMNLEMETLKVQTKEMYCRESKVLGEARDAAVMERDRAVASEREVAEKYEELLKEYHSLQGVSGRRLAEMEGELQLVRFDKDRQSLVYEELVKDHRQLQLEQEKLQKKVELLTEEVWCVKREGEAKVKVLEAQLVESRTQLEGYHQVEKELDDIVMQSAQLDHSCDAEQVLFTYGFGTSIPTNAKRRLQQSVHLARRVLQLERVNSGLRDQLRWEGEKVSRLQEDLESSRELVCCSQQPGSYMLERVKEQQEKLQHSDERVRSLKGEIVVLKQENSVLQDTKNKMSADLEKLLSHREELLNMKAVLTGRGTRASSVPAGHSSPTANNRSSGCHHRHHHPQHPLSTPVPHQPRPTVFTKQSLPSSSPLLPHQS